MSFIDSMNFQLYVLSCWLGCITPDGRTLPIYPGVIQNLILMN